MVDGTVKCWGYNGYGQLGDGTTTQRTTPVVAGVSSVTSTSTGAQHTCAAIADGTVQCWGGNYSGQLGDGTLTQRLEPTPVLSFP
jgi:alpha-tubulin suppressor-like RCC1 family protein